MIRQKFTHYLVWFGLLLIGQSVMAQDASPIPPPSPTPITTGVIEAKSDWMFPFGAGFTLILDMPPNALTSAVLSISQTGWPSQTLVAQPQPVDNQDGRTRIRYLWEIPQNNPPNLFEPIAFTWLFTKNDGTLITYAETTTFTDPDFGWGIDNAPDSPIVLAAPDNTLRPIALRRHVVSLVERLRSTTGQALSGIKIVLYDGSTSLERCPFDNQVIGVNTELRLSCTTGVLERLYAAQGYTVMRVTPLNGASALSALTDYLVDTAYTPLWTGQDVPAWFRFGLKRFYDPTTKTDQLGLVINAARNGSLLPSLDTPPTAQNRALWEAQATGWVLYMAEQVGFDGVLSVASSLSPDRSLADAYSERTGSPLSSVGVGWRTWLFTERASALYGLSLYAPATATASPTATITLTPTMTHTPTTIPSRTPTPTPSDTPAYTPSNTRTATVTATPTPTTTLRPRVSFTPSVVQSGGDTQTVESISDITSVIVLVLGAISLIGYIQRRLSGK